VKKIFHLVCLVLFCQELLYATPRNDTINKPVILVLNSFDAHANKYRKNKKELFAELTDSLKSYLSAKLIFSELGQPVIINDLMPPVYDTTFKVDSLQNVYKAVFVIAIKKLDVYFEQKGVEVERDSDGSKTRTAFYDICAEVDYVLYKTGDKPYHSKTKNCEYFTKRNVASGLLAGGPDIVGKSKYTYEMIAKNASRYLLEIQGHIK